MALKSIRSVLSFKSSGNLEGKVFVRVHSRKALKATSPRESTYHSSSPSAGSLATWALSKQLRMCCLTIRSPGPIAAGRHLGYKSLAQIPACRNRPVSLYVRHHKMRPACEFRIIEIPAYGQSRSLRSMKYQISRVGSPSQSSMKWVNSSEVRCWLALRAGVLRRAVSPSSTAQERRAEVRANAVSQGNRCPTR